MEIIITTIIIIATTRSVAAGYAPAAF